jgi:hypothetical protein
VTTEEVRAALIERAEFWFRLAEEQDNESSNVAGPVPPPAAGESQPAAQQQQQVLTGSPSDFGKLIVEETEKWAKVVKLSGAKLD